MNNNYPTARELIQLLGGSGGKAKCPLHKDDTASVSAKDRQGEHPLVTCFAGCRRTDLEKYLEQHFGVSFTMNQLPATLPKATKLDRENQLIAKYIYDVDHDGIPLEKWRHADKSMMWKRVTPLGKFVRKQADHGPLPAMLYRIAEVHACIADGDRVLFVEGEKDVNTAWEGLDLPATTNPDGASGPFRPDYLKMLEGAREVIIIADNDEPGLKHGREFAVAFTEGGFTVRLLTLPQKDLTDYVEAGGSRDDLISRVNAAPIFQLDGASRDPYKLFGAHIATDLCNSRRLVTRHGTDLRYVESLDKWRVWNGQIWSESKSAANQRAQETATIGIDQEIATLEAFASDVAQELQKWSKKSQDGTRLKYMVELAKTDKRVLTTIDDFDREPYLLNTPSGIVDLRSGELSPHDRDRMCTMMTSIPYVPGARCTEWEELLNYMTDGQRDFLEYLQIASGYSITSHSTVSAYFHCWGPGGNAKSTFTMANRQTMGTYGASIPKQAVMMKQHESNHDASIGKLINKRYVSVGELKVGDLLDESKVKQLTGGDVYDARKPHAHEELSLKPTYHFWGVGNDRPVISNNDDGIWRRMHFIEFPKKIINPDERRRDWFKEDYDAQVAILAWQIEGAMKWFANGQRLTVLETMSQETNNYREEMDGMSYWIREKCMTGEGLVELVSTLHSSYYQYMPTIGHKPLAIGKFSASLQSRGFKSTRIGRDKVTQLDGIQLKP